MTVATGDRSETLWFKRRLILPGYRIHLFGLRLESLDRLARCSLSLVEGEGGAVKTYDLAASLADWRTPGAAAVIRAIAAELSESREPVDAAPFARALSIMAAWCVPCRYYGEEGGTALAVFEFVPARSGHVSLLLVQDGALRVAKAAALHHDLDSVCLLWAGEAFDQAFVEVEGDFLELKLDPPRQARDVPLPRWFAGLEPRQRDDLLDGWISLGGGADANYPRFARQMPTRRELTVGDIAVTLEGLYQLGERLILWVSAPEAWSGRVSLADGGEGKRSFAPLAMATTVSSDHVYVVGCDDADAVPLGRLTLSQGDATVSCWLTVQDPSEPEARQALRARIVWDVADEALVGAFAAYATRAEADATTAPSVVVLSRTERGRRSPLVICHYDGDEVRLRASLLALRLSLGGDVAVRLVHGSRLASDVIMRLRSLSQSLGIEAELVMCGGGVPLSAAFALRGSDREHSAVIVMANGLVPLDAASWSKAIGRLPRTAALLYWQPAAPGSGPRRAVDYLASGAPMIMASPKLAAMAFTPKAELHTFEGLIRFVLAEVAAGGISTMPTSLPAMYFSFDGSPSSSYGDVRLDDAVIDARFTAGFAEADAGEFEPRLVALRGVRVDGS
ncbi:MAG: hypothetical protein KDK07_02355 [Bauldia sp.]|nr:hypothetical protein [Bauldia sp.]